MSKRKTADWLEDKSWHRIRNEMLISPAWRAASPRARAMIWTIVGELGKHSGKDNDNLLCTNQDMAAAGFSRRHIRPTLIELEALGLLAFKRGRPGLKGYGKARRFRIPFLPILDVDGKEIGPPTDEWARFGTTEEAKAAVQRALKRAKILKTSSAGEPLNSSSAGEPLSPDYLSSVAANKAPKNLHSHGSAGEPLSTSRNQSLQQYATVEAGRARYVLSADPRAMEQFSFVGRGRYRIGNVIPFNTRAVA
jgi:hypothetical protein